MALSVIETIALTVFGITFIYWIMHQFVWVPKKIHVIKDDSEALETFFHSWKYKLPKILMLLAAIFLAITNLV